RVILTSILGVVALAAGLQGWLLRKCRFFERIMLIAAALMLIEHSTVSDVIGLVVLILTVLNQRRTLHSKASKAH
ncbi:MAG: DUF3394 domain-containing protein, partial [Firmicutes bacterium]|nr:DUF3394 domain-containing protein [Bacillota bacterium]